MATAIDQDSPDVTGASKMAGADPKPLLETSYKEVYAADEETLVRLFRTKMKHALAERGYHRDAQAQVSELVERNVISCGIIANGSQLMRGDLFEHSSIRTQLEDLMTTGFQVNSNEPVVLILADGDDNVSWDAVSAIKQASYTVLSENFNILPVRVYVAQHPDSANRTVNSRSGFSLAMLNVVNTDIGGPSMIQLLDDDTTSPDWQRMVVYAEARHGNELLWVHERESLSRRSPKPHDVKEEFIAQTSVNIQDTRNEPAGAKEPELESDPASDPAPEPQTLVSVDQHVERNPSQDIDADENPVLTEHPAMTELLLREAQRGPVQHPSWARHGDADSLIDLIRRQASITIDPESLAELDGADGDTKKQR